MNTHQQMRYLFFGVLIRPFIWFFLRPKIQNRERLILKGPAIIVANHNSHLDTLVLMSLFPLHLINQVRPAGAADYFLKKRYLKWFSKVILQMIPVARPTATSSIRTKSVFVKISKALLEDVIVIYYPEGTRGRPEQWSRCKKGIAKLAESHPEVPILPIHLQGLGKVLPKGSRLLVPYNIKIKIGTPLPRTNTREEFIDSINDFFTSPLHHNQEV